MRYTVHFLFFGASAPQWARHRHSRGCLDHTQRRTTVARTPLDEWSARRTYLYLTTHNTHNRQTSIPPVGFELTISEGERPQTCALDRAATGTPLRRVCVPVTGPVVVQRVDRVIDLLFHERGTRRGWGVSSTPRPLFPPWKEPVPIVQEAGWAPGPVWTGAENLALKGIRSPDRQVRSQSLYRMSYAAHTTCVVEPNILHYWVHVLDSNIKMDIIQCSHICKMIFTKIWLFNL